MLKLDAYTLKIIAVVGMVISHIPYMFWGVFPTPVFLVMSALGGLTFPIMAYFAVEGYRHTSNLKKYMLRLLVAGLVAIPFHLIVIGMTPLNIMFAIILGLLTLLAYDRIKHKVVFWILYVLIIPVFTFLFIEYMLMGNLMMLLYHIIKKEKIRRIVPSIVSGSLFILLAVFTIASINMFEAQGISIEEARYITGLGRHLDLEFMYGALAFGVCTILAVPYLLSSYTGERGKVTPASKWLFYVVYPAHLAVLAGLGWLFGFVA